MAEDMMEIDYDKAFKRYLPDTLYKDHYTLSKEYGGTPLEWRAYLRDNAQFIASETAAIAEPQARNALKKLSNASSAETSAIKALLETSKLINEAQTQQTKIIFSFIPSSEHKKEEDITPSSQESD